MENWERLYSLKPSLLCALMAALKPSLSLVLQSEKNLTEERVRSVSPPHPHHHHHHPISVCTYSVALQQPSPGQLTELYVLVDE